VARYMTRSGHGSNFGLPALHPGMFNLGRDFSVASGVASAPRMKVNIVETDPAYILTADVPGADREDITVMVAGNTVSIRADVEKEIAAPERNMLVIEHIRAEESRTFTLPHDIDESKAEARVENGVLVLKLPKKTGTTVRVRQDAEGKLARGPAPGALGQFGVTAGKTSTVNLKINGSDFPLQIESRVTLLDALREYAHLYGTKKGCDLGQCGACTVHINGRRVLACLTLAAQAEGQDILTIEGVAENGALHAMQDAFIRHDALQCGYCTPGQIMSAIACIAEGHASSDASIREYMSGNLCRCGTYTNIVAAVREMAGAQAPGKEQTS
jgi:xanthine dehydrogenase YagT iron-sulfur-binding subunit